jgi:hypothetical protein
MKTSKSVIKTQANKLKSHSNADILRWLSLSFSAYLNRSRFRHEASFISGKRAFIHITNMKLWLHYTVGRNFKKLKFNNASPASKVSGFLKDDPLAFYK